MFSNPLFAGGGHEPNASCPSPNHQLYTLLVSFRCSAVCAPTLYTLNLTSTTPAGSANATKTLRGCEG